MDFFGVRETMMQFADEEYRAFNAKIVPTAYPMIGVRAPLLRKFAKAADENYLEADPEYYEEVVLHGFVVGRTAKTAQTLAPLLNRYLSFCDNWAAIDMPAGSMAAFKKDAEACFAIAKAYAMDEREYYARFGAVALLSHYIDETHIDAVLQAYAGMPHGKYYTDMAAAWGLSVAAVKFYDKTMDVLRSRAFSPFVTLKALSKCLDSFRVNDARKQEIRALRQQIKTEAAQKEGIE